MSVDEEMKRMMVKKEGWQDEGRIKEKGVRKKGRRSAKNEE